MKVGSWYKPKNKQSGCGSALLKRKWMSCVEYLLNECKWKLQYSFLSHTHALLSPSSFSLSPSHLSLSISLSSLLSSLSPISLLSLSLCLSLSSPPFGVLRSQTFFSSQYWEMSCWEAPKMFTPALFPRPSFGWSDVFTYVSCTSSVSRATASPWILLLKNLFPFLLCQIDINSQANSFLSDVELQLWTQKVLEGWSGEALAQTTKLFRNVKKWSCGSANHRGAWLLEPIIRHYRPAQSLSGGCRVDPSSISPPCELWLSKQSQLCLCRSRTHP